MLFIGTVVLILTVGVLIHWTQRKRRAAVANLPGFYCPPVIGALHLFMKIDPKRFLNQCMEWVEKLGTLQRIWIFNRLIIVSCDLEFNEQLMSSQEHLVKHPVYKVLKQWLGNGLLLSDGSLWHQRRKILTPTFHFSILEQFVEVFDQQTNILVERLAQKANGHSIFDVYPFICLAALDIIAETAMGTKVHAQQTESTSYAKAVNECTKLFSWRFMSVYLHNELLFTVTHPHLKWRQMQYIRTMHDFTINVIKQRRQALEQQQHQEDREDEQGGKKRMVLLDLLLKTNIDGRPLSNDEIREEVDTFMFEGHDTTTSATSFCLWEISRHADVQAQLLAEINEVLGSDRSRPVTIRDLTELRYMESVIRESLRLHPPVPVVGRKLQSDFKYSHSKFGNGVIPAGSEVIMGVVGQQCQEEHYKDAHLFNPQRHDHPDGTPTFAYVPFSAGPRNCIGQKFAQLEMKMLLAKILREYELLPLGESIRPIVDIVMRSETGFQLAMRRRGESI